MSYILDALKRAEIERERERGAVPTLASSTASKAPAARGLLVPTLMVLVLVLAAAALAAWLRPATSTGAPTVASTSASMAAPPASAIVPAPTREIVREAPPPPLLVAPPPSVRSATAVAQAPMPVAAPAAFAPNAVRAGASTLPTTAASAGVANSAIPALAELAPAMRQGMPAINVNGAVNAPAAADRLLFVNGQVLHEGDTIAAELRIETIGVHSAQLSWRGQRFRVDY